MELFPIRTPLLAKGDDLPAILANAFPLAEGDILVLSSKTVATVEGRTTDLRTIRITDEALSWANRIDGDPAFHQAVLDETARMCGRVVGEASGTLLTELNPAGLGEGTLLVPNAGLDRSNVAEGFAIGWPRDPVASVTLLRRTIRGKSGADIAVILTDSGLSPRRLGVTAFALACAGVDPLESRIGRPDLFGKHLRVTVEARADQLATAANFLMGNAGESVPAAVIRGHDLPLTDFAGWVPGIERERDLYHGII